MPATVIRSILLVAAPLACSLSARAEPPRYRFEPGQHLVFAGGEVAETRNSRLGLDRETEFLVVAARPDGRWRLIVRERYARFTERQGEDRKVHPERVELLVVDVAPDGTIEQRDEDMQGVLNRLLPVLPADERHAAGGWSFTGAATEHACTTTGGAEGTWTFQVEPTSDVWDMRGFAATRSYTFDRAKGLITAMTVQHRHRGKDTRRGTDTLVRTERLDQATVAALAADLDAYVEAERRYARTLARAMSNCSPQVGHARLAEAIHTLRAVRAGLSSELLGEHVDGIIAGHERAAGGYASRISTAAALLCRPAPPWSLSDLAGGTRSLEDYKGQVVVLDFWYRNCSWCIKAVPQLKALARRFEGRPVAVLGMNVDKDPADAKYVVDKLAIGYPTLLTDRGFAQRYGVRAYPTLLVIDAEGELRHLHRGFSPTLEDDLASVIEDLLAEKTKTEG